MALNKVTEKIQGHPDWHATSLEDFEEWVDIVKGRTDTTIYRGSGNTGLCFRVLVKITIWKWCWFMNESC